jgi:hypothetical protein
VEVMQDCSDLLSPFGRVSLPPLSSWKYACAPATTAGDYSGFAAEQALRSAAPVMADALEALGGAATRRVVGALRWPAGVRERSADWTGGPHAVGREEAGARLGLGLSTLRRVALERCASVVPSAAAGVSGCALSTARVRPRLPPITSLYSGTQ